MARVTVRVQGSKDSKRLQILLLKEEGQWRVVSASEEPKVAKASPQPESKKKPSIKASPSRSRKKPHKNRLPATTTNKQLADYVRSKPDIENLYINNCRNITDISPLASLSRLSVLSMDWCSKLEDISPLTNYLSPITYNPSPGTPGALAALETHKRMPVNWTRPLIGHPTKGMI
ncbi:MAG: leucine-rich repeat domain-containing protein [Planctomycetota bacterium]|jgi:hypothetical protein